STFSAISFCFLVSLAIGSALHHFEAHRTGGTFDDLRRLIDVVGVEILHLGFSDLAHLAAGHLASDSLARLLGARLQLGGLLQEISGRRRLGFECERAVGIDRDHGGDRHAFLEFLRRGVERLAELHDVHAALTQRRTDRRRRGSRARGHLQLDVTFDFLGHEWPPFSLSPRRYTEAHGKRFERAPALAKEPSRMDSRAVAVGSGAVRRNACQIQAPPAPSTSNGSVPTGAEIPAPNGDSLT